MTPDLRMGKITYINASPVYYGIDHGMHPDWLTLVPDVPAALNHKIKNGEIDLSPISAAYYAMNHQDLLILPDLSISCDGQVLSVICASRYPLDQLSGRKVVFSNESASGASFLKMIFAGRGISPEFAVGPVGDLHRVPADTDAVMVIGDAALSQPWEERFEYRFDLGALWHEMTGLPFVFALWVVRKAFAEAHPELTAAAHDLLLASRAKGDKHVDEIAEAGRRRLGLSKERIRAYYDCLACDLDERKIQGMTAFFKGLFDQGILKDEAVIRFFDPGKGAGR